MANSDNKINISDVWKGMDEIKINIGDVWKGVTEGYVNVGDEWKQFWAPGAGGGRGIFAGGAVLGGGIVNTMEYVTIGTTGDAIDFGNLTLARESLAGCSNGTSDRGLFAGGDKSGAPQNQNVIDYITMSSTGNATNFGDLTQERNDLASCSNGPNDRGVFCGGGMYGSDALWDIIDYVTISSSSNAGDFGNLTGDSEFSNATSNGTNERGVIHLGSQVGSSYLNTIDYITISTPSNASDFGDLTVVRSYGSGACSNDVGDRGLFFAGWNGSAYVNVVDYITISSIGNATNFGDLTATCSNGSACSNGVNDRGLNSHGVAGGTRSNVIDYVTISCTSNANDFGDLATARGWTGACSNGATIIGEGTTPGDRGVCGGGQNGGNTNVMDYVTISTGGDATNFGDLTYARSQLSSCSNSTGDRGTWHGGIGASVVNIIDYATISSASNATNFGDCSWGTTRYMSGTSNGTSDRGIIFSDASKTDRISYITISSTGNTADFGNLTVARYLVMALSNYTLDRGCACGGDSTTNTIDYITISSTGNATDFGDLTVARSWGGGTSNGTRDRGVIMGGSNNVTIDYITISSTGNATDFSDLPAGQDEQACFSNAENNRACSAGGDISGIVNTINCITISSLCNATDFGDLTVARYRVAGCSNG